MRVRETNQRGFSLIELMIVLVVMMVMAGWAILGTGSSLNNKANAAMGTVVTQMRQARQIAISSRRNVLVTFTPPNKIQLAVQTLPGEAAATAPAPVYLNDNAKDGMVFMVFPSVPDTPMAFGNSQAITLAPATGGTAGLSVLFTTQGSFVGTTAASNYSQVGNSNLVNASIFLGYPGKTSSARAVTILGGTGRVRSFNWDGTNWNE
jgi:prepilin-type N-terminal cleavage/methylation domain-containing protein